jgi:protein-serine/threonine kinase
MSKLQEEMNRAEEEGGSFDDEEEMHMKKPEQVALNTRRNLSKSTMLVSDRNQPKLLDDSSQGMGYSSF